MEPARLRQEQLLGTRDRHLCAQEQYGNLFFLTRGVNHAKRSFLQDYETGEKSPANYKRWFRIGKAGI
jgi:hypothetical protein